MCHCSLANIDASHSHILAGILLTSHIRYFIMSVLLFDFCFNFENWTHYIHSYQYYFIHVLQIFNSTLETYQRLPYQRSFNTNRIFIRKGIFISPFSLFHIVSWKKRSICTKQEGTYSNKYRHERVPTADWSELQNICWHTLIDDNEFTMCKSFFDDWFSRIFFDRLWWIRTRYSHFKFVFTSKLFCWRWKENKCSIQIFWLPYFKQMLTVNAVAVAIIAWCVFLTNHYLSLL